MFASIMIGRCKRAREVSVLPCIPSLFLSEIKVKRLKDNPVKPPSRSRRETPVAPLFALAAGDSHAEVSSREWACQIG